MNACSLIQTGDRSLKVPLSDIRSLGKLYSIHSCVWMEWILNVSEISCDWCDQWCSFSLCGHWILSPCPDVCTYRHWTSCFTHYIIPWCWRQRPFLKHSKLTPHWRGKHLRRVHCYQKFILCHNSLTFIFVSAGDVEWFNFSVSNWKLVNFFVQGINHNIIMFFIHYDVLCGITSCESW